MWNHIFFLNTTNFWYELYRFVKVKNIYLDHCAFVDYIKNILNDGSDINF